jgi:hypothetical protein
MTEPYILVPTCENGVWTHTAFYSREEFREFVKSLFKEEGPDTETNVWYEFDETAELFNAEARKFNKHGFYCDSPKMSKDYITYWDTQKERCRKGGIYKNNGKTWYLPRDYYFWVNFLPIYDKEEKRFRFPKVQDSQYHMALYETLAELYYSHVVITKKRQYGSSYYHMAKILNQYWFESGAVLKVGASLKDYINEKGSWKYLNEYKDFLNGNTAWYRPADPNKPLNWMQRISVRENDRDTYKGLKSTITGYSFEKDATNGVGGPVVYFFMEEAGICPKMDETYEYIRPALQMGMTTTGMFIAAGSVGDLDQCKPLEKMMRDPVGYQMYPVRTKLLDDKGTEGLSGLFIPEQWNMQPFIDQYGNSQVKEALEAILEERKEWKKTLPADKYQLRISQKPINLYETFAYRKESPFPLHLVNRQIKRIEDKEYPIQYVDVVRGEKGLEVVPSRRLPMTFPIDKKAEDKSGVICMTEAPRPGAPWGTYYASVDPINATGKTTTSESLFCIYIYRNEMQVTRKNANGQDESYIERGDVVMWWFGRFDDSNKTNDRAMMMVELYNAWTVVEKNVPSFITYMQNKNKQHLLVPKTQMLFYKDLKAEISGNIEYGWHNQGTFFQSVLLDYLINFLKEELGEPETKPDGTVVKTTYGIERIPDINVLKEMVAYNGEGNYDNLVALAALIAFVKVQEPSMGLRKMNVEDTKLEKPGFFSNLSRSPFSNIGRKPGKFKKQPFNHYR